MAQKANKKRVSRASRRAGRIFLAWITAIFFVGLPVAAVVILRAQNSTQVGQLVPSETNVSGFSSSLDLRVAAKNSYPSAPLAIVRDVGSDTAVDKKVISFAVKDDGLTEFGLMYLPAGQVPKNGFPAIIYCHGYENPARYSTVTDQTFDMEFYAEHGFAVIKPDYRGQGLSIHQGLPNSAYYSMSYNTDVMSLISALKQTKYINSANLNLFGFSLGGYIALRAAVLSPEIKNLILVSGPVDSLSKMYLTYIPPSDVNNLNALKTRNEVFSKYGTPADADNFWKYASPINLVGRLKARVQINVGALDQTVPPEFSADLNAALNQAHISHDYFVYPDGSHSLYAQRSLIWSRSLQILQPTNSSTLSA